MAAARQMVLQRLSGRSDIVDVGCGPGHDSHFWSEAGHRVIGIDACPAMVEAAHANYPRLEFVELDLFSLGNLGRSFDVVWCSYCLLHVDEARIDEALGSISGALRKQGLLFIATAVAAETATGRSAIAGLTDVHGNDVLVATVRWNVEELRLHLNKAFMEEWSEILEPIPGKGAYHAIWTRSA